MAQVSHQWLCSRGFPISPLCLYGLLSRASCHDGGCHYLISTSTILLQRALHICVFVDGWLLLQVADVSQVITHPQQKYFFCNSTYESGLLRARDAVKQPGAGH
jgi:hypothetical protein